MRYHFDFVTPFRERWTEQAFKEAQEALGPWALIDTDDVDLSVETRAFGGDAVLWRVRGFATQSTEEKVKRLMAEQQP